MKEIQKIQFPANVKIIFNDGRETTKYCYDSFELKFLLQFNPIKEYYAIKNSKEA